MKGKLHRVGWTLGWAALVGVLLGGCSHESASIPDDVDCDSLVYASNHAGTWDIYTLNADVNVKLTEAGRNVNPSWSPEGDRILFTSIADGYSDLYVMQRDGSAVTPLTSGKEFESSSDWSPDGSTIVLDRVVDDDADLRDHDKTDFAQVFIVPFGEPLGVATQLTSGEPNAKPKLSPEGDHIAFLSWRDGNAEIYVMSLDGSAQTNLTNHFGFDVLPSWSPDGSRIAFVSDRDGANQIYVMNSDGSAPTRITDNPEPVTNPGWSSDGQHILYTTEHAPHEIFAIPAGGGQRNRIAFGFTHECSPTPAP